MTTTVKIQVNGRYRAHVSCTHANGEKIEHVVEGNYEQSPNPAGEYSISLQHPADAVIRVSEEPVSDYVPTGEQGAS